MYLEIVVVELEPGRLLLPGELLAPSEEKSILDLVQMDNIFNDLK